MFPKSVSNYSAPSLNVVASLKIVIKSISKIVKNPVSASFL